MKIGVVSESLTKAKLEALKISFPEDTVIVIDITATTSGEELYYCPQLDCDTPPDVFKKEPVPQWRKKDDPHRFHKSKWRTRG